MSSTSFYHLPAYFYFYFWVRVFCWTYNSIMQLGRQASHPQGPSCLLPPQPVAPELQICATIPSLTCVRERGPSSSYWHSKHSTDWALSWPSVIIPLSSVFFFSLWMWNSASVFFWILSDHPRLTNDRKSWDRFPSTKWYLRTSTEENLSEFYYTDTDDINKFFSGSLTTLRTKHSLMSTQSEDIFDV